MKRFFKWMTILSILFFATLFLINGLDEEPDPRNFTLKDLEPLDLSRNNGYHYIFWLSQPENFNPLSEENLLTIRKLFSFKERDPAFKNKFDYMSVRGNYKRSNSMKIHLKSLKLPDAGKGRLAQILLNEEKIRHLTKTYKVELSRYKRGVQSPSCSEYHYPEVLNIAPNYLIFYYISSIYNAQALLGINKNWSDSVDSVLQNISFLKKLSGSAGTLISGLIYKSCMRESLLILGEIMNQKDCPKEVYLKILKELKPIKESEYLSINSLIAECLTNDAIITENSEYIESSIKTEYTFPFNYLPKSIFLHTNRTKNHLNRSYRRMIAYNKTPPHQWKIPTDRFFESLLPEKPSIWSRNSMGKMFLLIAMPNYSVATFKSYRLKAVHDMTLILADIHSRYQKGDKVEDLLAQSEFYKQIDLCSGKPYKWNPEKRLLYSIGTDRTDNKGVEKKYSSKNWQTDIAAPVTLKRPSQNE